MKFLYANACSSGMDVIIPPILNSFLGLQKRNWPRNFKSGASQLRDQPLLKKLMIKLADSSFPWREGDEFNCMFQTQDAESKCDVLKIAASRLEFFWHGLGQFLKRERVMMDAHELAINSRGGTW